MDLLDPWRHVCEELQKCLKCSAKYRPTQTSFNWVKAVLAHLFGAQLTSYCLSASSEFMSREHWDLGHVAADWLVTLFKQLVYLPFCPQVSYLVPFSHTHAHTHMRTHMDAHQKFLSSLSQEQPTAFCTMQMLRHKSGAPLQSTRITQKHQSTVLCSALPHTMMLISMPQPCHYSNRAGLLFDRCLQKWAVNLQVLFLEVSSTSGYHKDNKHTIILH